MWRRPNFALVLAQLMAYSSSLVVEQGELRVLVPGETLTADVITLYGTLRCGRTSGGRAS